MSLEQTFSKQVEQLPDDWTDLAVDLRITDEGRYVEAATRVVTCNAQPYSNSKWHWRIPVAHRFGHGAAVPAVVSTLRLLDNAGFAGELRIGDVRAGRVEITHDWGRPDSVTRELRQIRSQ